MGYSAEYAANNLQDQTTVLIELVEFLFSLFYLLELMFRIFALGWFFFFNPDLRWNAFDAFLVVIAVFDQIMTFSRLDAGRNTSQMRIARLPKMFRLVRVFRIMRMFRPLRLILKSILGSMKAMLWSTVLILIVTYVVGIVILQAATEEREIALENLNSVERIEEYWSSLRDAMLSLYMSSTGGIDWKDAADSVKPMGAFYYLVFLLYMTFFIFVIMNTLTSLFVSTSIRSAERDQQNIIAEEMRKKHDHIQKIKTLFKNLATHNQVKLTQPDFEIVLQDPEMMAFMSTLEIEPMDVEQFFSILSNDGKDGVDLNDFVVGCMRMGGQARSMDLLGLIHNNKIETKRRKQMQRDLASIKVLLQTKLGLSPEAFAHELSSMTAVRSSQLVGKSII